MNGISIIIPVFNAEKTLRKCLNSLLSQQFTGGKFEIILVDDQSTDSSAKIIETYISSYPNIVYTKLEKNAGPAKARNTGASRAIYDILAFIDSDAYAESHWLENISVALQDETIVACGGTIRNANTSFFSNINHILEFSGFDHTEPKKVRTIPSVNLIYRKNIFDELGGFDEHLRIGEDSDLNSRLSKRGYALYFYPDIIVSHDTQDGFIHSLKKQYRFGCDSFKYRRKNPESNYQFVYNKFLFVFAFPFYIMGNIYLYIRRPYFYTHTLKSILGLPFIFLLRFIFWTGVARYLFFFDKEYAQR